MYMHQHQLQLGARTCGDQKNQLHWLERLLTWESNGFIVSLHRKLHVCWQYQLITMTSLTVVNNVQHTQTISKMYVQKTSFVLRHSKQKKAKLIR